MSEKPEVSTFNLGSVLAGIDYPEVRRPIYFKASLGFAIYELEKHMRTVELLGDAEELKSLTEKMDALMEDIKPHQFHLILRGIPESTRDEILLAVQKKYPAKTNFLNQVEDDPEADIEFAREMWSAHVVGIATPEGEVHTLSRTEAKDIYDKATSQIRESVTSGINELTRGAAAGFEYAARELDFLSNASPEG